MLDHRFVLQPQPRRTRIHQRRLGSRCVRARARACVCVCVGGSHTNRLLSVSVLPTQFVRAAGFWINKNGDGNSYLSRNATINPSFHNWTMVYVRYCDGSSFSGLATSPVRAPPGKAAVFHSGNYILRGVIADLVESHGLGKNSIMRGGFCK